MTNRNSSGSSNDYRAHCSLFSKSPYVAILWCSSILAIGCSQDAPNAGEKLYEVATMPTLDNMQWQAVSIGGKRVIERSAPTLLLDADGQLSGSTGCNNYFGHWSAFGSNASFEASGASLRACEPELMEQERAFLNALKTTTSIAASPDGTLSLVDATSVVQLLLVSVDQENDSAAPTVPSDLPNSTLYRFECGDAGPVEFRFLGPETIELTVKPERYILQHQRAASGAQYEGDDAEFWNRGNEAILALGGERFRCERSAD